MIPMGCQESVFLFYILNVRWVSVVIHAVRDLYHFYVNSMTVQCLWSG